MNEPSLELSPEEWERVQLLARSAKLPAVLDLLDFLLRLEAGRQKFGWEVNAARAGIDCRKLPEAKWTLRDWLAAVRRDKLGE